MGRWIHLLFIIVEDGFDSLPESLYKNVLLASPGAYDLCPNIDKLVHYFYCKY
jgi:hypothetical protein